MREILFRGKRIDNGQWVAGNLFIPSPTTDGRVQSTEILRGINISRISFVVDPKTVGQYTGLKCKNGRIFEGDIIRFDDGKGVINFNIGCFCVKLFDADKYCLRNPAIDVVLNEYPAIEVIGNIHDNPELMEVR